MLAVLILVPARLAQGPAAAQASDGSSITLAAGGNSAAPMTGATPTVCIVALSVMTTAGFVLTKRIRKPS